MTTVSPANAEAIEAWDGPLFERFVKYRHLVVAGLERFAALVGPGGSAVGVDAAPRFIEAARAEAQEARVDDVRFDVMDVERASFDERFDYAFSRMGTMFFANPVAALRNVREALVPGGLLVMVVWRAKDENEWLHRAQLITERFVTKPDDRALLEGMADLAGPDGVVARASTWIVTARAPA